MITLLKYGNTNTYLVGNLLVDTDLPGTLPALWRELKRQGIPQGRIGYVLATHYHPDHIGLVGDLEPRGFLGGYDANEALREDWENLISRGARIIRYGHANEQTITE